HVGFNIVAFKGRVYGIRNALGAVDLEVGDDMLKRHYGAGDIVIGDSEETVRLQIDRIEHANAMRNDLQHQITESRRLQSQSSEELSRIAAELAGMREQLRVLVQSLSVTEQLRSQVEHIQEVQSQLGVLLEHLGLDSKEQKPTTIGHYRGFY